MYIIKTTLLVFNVNTLALATEDFDTFVNQEWKDTNPIPDDQVRWGPS